MAFNPSLIDVTPTQAGSGATPNMLATLGNSLAGVLTAFSPAEKARRERAIKNEELQMKLNEQRLKSEEQEFDIKGAKAKRDQELYNLARASEADDKARSVAAYSAWLGEAPPEIATKLKEVDTDFANNTGPKLSEAGKVLPPALQQRVEEKAYDAHLKAKAPELDTTLRATISSDKQRKINALKALGYSEQFEPMMEIVPSGPGKIKAVFNPEWKKDAAKGNEGEDKLRQEAAKKGMITYGDAPMEEVVKFLGKKEKAPSDADLQFSTNTKVFGEKLNELEAAVNKFGNYEQWDEEGKAKLGALPYQLAIMYAKIVDPGSVAREGEVKAAQQYLIPMSGYPANSSWYNIIPEVTRNKVTLNAIKHMRKSVEDYQKARGEAKGDISDPGNTSKKEEAPSGVKADESFDDSRVNSLLKKHGYIK